MKTLSLYTVVFPLNSLVFVLLYFLSYKLSVDKFQRNLPL